MKNNQIRQTIRFIEWVAFTFILVLGCLMAHDSMQREHVLGAGLLKLNEMKEKDLSEPGLAKTVRDFDYLYRATYFQTQDRQAHGFLLLGSAFLLLCVLMSIERFMFMTPLEIPKQISSHPENERKQILVFSTLGLVLLCATIIALRWTQPKFPTLQTESIAEHKPGQTDQPTQIVQDSGKTIAIPVEEISLTTALEEETHHWPQFRGSVLPNQNPLPKSWDFAEKWNVKIPLEGYNSPVVWGDNIFVAGGNITERAVFCFDAETGDERWKIACTEAPHYPDTTEDTGISAPTLCVDKHRVYAIFATGEMICCVHTGEVVWRKQMPDPEIMYGYASSLLLLGDRLIVQYDLEESQTLYALSVFTGESLWETKREASTSWSTPTALVKDGKAVIFTAGNKTAEVCDAETGDILWQKECMGGEVATSAFAKDNIFYFSNASAFTGAFSAMDGEILCKNEGVPAPDVASPVLFGDQYMLFGSGGSVIAINAKDATELYEEYFDNGFYSSPVVVQNKIVAINLDGDLFLMDATAESLTIEGKFSLEKKVVAVPAFYKEKIIVRTSENELICLEAK